MLIFANGEIPRTDWLRPYLAKARVIIAADGGAKHILKENRTPDYLVGDLDSLSEDAIADFVKRGSKIRRYPPDKNESDLELALIFAVENREWNGWPILVFGVLGGRLDQMLANILLLAHPRLTGRPIRLIEQFQQAWLVSTSTTIEGEIGDRVSLVPLRDDVVIGSTSGLQWPLKDETLVFGMARGISNEITSLPVQIELRAGLALCVHIEKSWIR